MSYDNRDLQIAISTGVNATATLAAGTVDPVGYFIESVEKVVGAVLDAHATFGNAFVDEPTEAQAVSNVIQAFPGTQVVQQAVQPAYSPAQAAPVAPAPIPGASNQAAETEALWQQFFTALNGGQVAPDWGTARTHQWFDNRNGKSKPTQPDFKVKGNKGENTPGLFLTGKGNPAWVAQALRQAGFL